MRRTEPRSFLVTAELDRLARWLRLLGCDVVAYRGKPQAIYPAAYREGRTILTCSRHITPSALVQVIHLDPNGVDRQLKALSRQLKLRWSPQQLFTRCGLCNTPLTPIAKARVKSRVPAYVHRTQQRFTTCPVCHRIYWTATHGDRAKAFLRRLGVVSGRS